MSNATACGAVLLSQLISSDDNNEANGATTAEKRRTLFGGLGALQYRDFRIFWFGSFVSYLGTWMQTIAQGSLMFELTKSESMLGLVGFIGSLPMFLFGPFAGAVADRFDKKHILYITQSTFALSALTMGLLAVSGLIQPWHIIALALLNGLFFPFDAPARLSMVYALTGKEELANGIALNSGSFNLARMIGPAIGGWILQSYGAGWCFVFNGLSYAGILGATLMLSAETRPMPRQGVRLLVELTEGIKHIINSPGLRICVSMVALSSLFAFCYIPLMPAVQESVLQAEKQELGRLFSSVGIGSVCGLIYLAITSKSSHKGKKVIFANVACGLSLSLLAVVLSHYSNTHNGYNQWAYSLTKVFDLKLTSFQALWTSKVLLACVGFSAVMQMALTNTIVQLYSPERLRGRALSVHIWSMGGLLPFGALWSGYAAKFIGVPNTLLIGSLITFFFGILVLLFGKSVKQLA